jgi:hypothetical protein
MSSAYARELWTGRHRFCNDDPGPIATLDEARFVLTSHAGHGPDCLQYHAAMARASEVAA